MKRICMALFIALLLQTQSRGGIFTGKGGLFHNDERAYSKLLEQVKAEEPVLFEGILGGTTAAYGFTIPRLRVIATPTALIFDDDRRFPYSWISSVRIGVYSPENDEDPGWEDALIINEKSVYLLVPENEAQKMGASPRRGSPERRALAERLAGIIEEHRHTVDVFSKALPPRTVDLALVENKAYGEWSPYPNYLNVRYKEDRKAFDELWNSAFEAITETFRQEMLESLVNRDAGADEYTFHYAGGFRHGWGHPRSNTLGPQLYEDIAVSRLNLQCGDLVTLGPILFWFTEKMDPQGTPSVDVTMQVSCDLFDSAHQERTRPRQLLKSSKKLTLREWLDGGQEGVIAAVEEGLREIAAKVEQEINSRAQAGDTPPKRGTGK